MLEIANLLIPSIRGKKSYYCQQFHFKNECCVRPDSLPAPWCLRKLNQKE